MTLRRCRAVSRASPGRPRPSPAGTSVAPVTSPTTSATTADAVLAADLVREAGRLALRMRREGLSAEQKTSVSDVVTAADRAAEELVLERLAARAPRRRRARRGGRRPRGHQRPHLGDRPGRRHLQLRPGPVLVVLGGRPRGRRRAGARRRPPPARGRDVRRRRRAAGHAATACRSSRWSTGRSRGRAWPPTCTRPRPAPTSARRRAAGRRARGHRADARLGHARRDGPGPGPAARHLPALRAAVGLACPAPRSSPPLGGAARHVEAAGRTWYVAGVPTAVDEVCAVLRSR